MMHAQLQKDTQFIGCLPLCSVLLMKDVNYPWCILVPKRENITEIYQLIVEEQMQLMRESSLLGETLMTLYRGDKLNIGALGNVVAQLHLHHIVRYKNDPAWPKPVWGARPAKDYAEGELSQRVAEIQAALSGADMDFSVQAAAET